MRHLHTPLLWVQSKVEERAVKVIKVDGKTNLADMGTKHIEAWRMNDFLCKFGFEFVAGRNKQALKADVPQQ